MNELQEFKLFIEGVAQKPLNHIQSSMVNSLFDAKKADITVELTPTGRTKRHWQHYVKTALEQQATLVSAKGKRRK